MIATEDVTTTELPKLTNEEIARYSRHLILPEVGLEGPHRLADLAKVVPGARPFGFGPGPGHE